MSKKSKNKDARQGIAEKSLSAALGVGVLAFVITGAICMLFTYVMSGSLDCGTILTLISAVLCALCWYRGFASVRTLAAISVIMGVCTGLIMGVVDIGIFYAMPEHDGFMELNRTTSLDAIGLATGIGPLDTVRRLLMNMFYTPDSGGFVFGISLAGILDLFIGIIVYVMVTMFMAKRLKK